jgi:hypothetical protein
MTELYFSSAKAKNLKRSGYILNKLPQRSVFKNANLL